MTPPTATLAIRRWTACIIVLAAALRLFPIWFGLPYAQARPDETVAVGRAVAILAGDPNPHFFHWPSLTFYLFAALFTVASPLTRVLSGEATFEFVEQVLVARAFVALAGAASVYVLYRLARRAADPVVGVLAAGFLAVAPLHVRESHFAMTDALMTLFVLISLTLLLRALDEARAGAGSALRWFAAAGFAGGLATSTKYNGGAIVAAMAASQFLLLFDSRAWRPARAWLPAVCFGAAGAAGFLVGSPYALLDFPTFSADLIFDFTHLSGGHAGLDLGRGWTYHLRRSLFYGAGPGIFAAAVAGLLPLAARYPRPAFVLGLFAASFYAALGSGYTVFFRYVLPLVPLFCLSAAVAVRHAVPWAAARLAIGPRIVMAFVLVMVAGPSLVNSVWMDVLLARTDTRVLAGRWLTSRLAPDDTVHDAGGDYTRLDLRAANYHPWLFDPETKSFGDPQGRTPDWIVIFQSPLRAYTGVPVEIRQLTADRYDLVHTVRATGAGASSSIYDLQDAFFLPISGFRPIERPGPTVQIYRRRADR